MAHQFFTTDTDINNSWFPMDHFFYARHPKGQRGSGVKGVVAHLEVHANISHPNGWSVDVVYRQGREIKVDQFDDYPTALRRMADIIEEHDKAQAKKQEARRAKRKAKKA